jgi:hypothetical protein
MVSYPTKDERLEFAEEHIEQVLAESRIEGLQRNQTLPHPVARYKISQNPVGRIQISMYHDYIK